MSTIPKMKDATTMTTAGPVANPSTGDRKQDQINAEVNVNTAGCPTCLTSAGIRELDEYF